MVVHGGIRHLETYEKLNNGAGGVHGGIRHLEMHDKQAQKYALSSWRHTPFRKEAPSAAGVAQRSWRHTPFRKI